MKGMFKRRLRCSRFERTHQIARILYYWDVGGGLTMTQIAFWLGLCPSTHLMGILRSAEKQGLIECRSAYHRPGVQKYLWKLTGVAEAMICEGRISS